MHWKFWKKTSDRNGGTGGKISRSARPRDLPEAVGRKMVVAHFGDIVHLSMANEENLLEVDGIGEKRAQSIIEGILHMRSRSVYR